MWRLPTSCPAQYTEDEEKSNNLWKWFSRVFSHSLRHQSHSFLILQCLLCPTSEIIVPLDPLPSIHLAVVKVAIDRLKSLLSRDQSAGPIRTVAAFHETR